MHASLCSWMMHWHQIVSHLKQKNGLFSHFVIFLPFSFWHALCWMMYFACCCSSSINKGIGVDNMHYLNDGLWKVFALYILMKPFVGFHACYQNRLNRIFTFVMKKPRKLWYPRTLESWFLQSCRHNSWEREIAFQSSRSASSACTLAV